MRLDASPDNFFCKQHRRGRQLGSCGGFILPCVSPPLVKNAPGNARIFGVVPHEPGVSVRRVVPEGGEGPFCYVVGLVGPHEVWRWKAPLFQCESRTGSCRDVVRGAPCVLVFHFVASDDTVLKAVIVLDVLVVELLLILVKLADSFGLLCDGGEILLGAAAFGPIVPVALGFLKPGGFLPALLGLCAVEVAGEAGPIVRITLELDNLPPALLSRRVVEAAGEAGPIVRITLGLGGLLPALLGRRAAEAVGDAGLIIRIALGRAVKAAGEAGPIVQITSGLNGLLVPASLGRRAAEGAGDAGPIVRIASEVAEEPVGFVEHRCPPEGPVVGQGQHGLLVGRNHPLERGRVFIRLSA